MELQSGTGRFRGARAWILALSLVATWATLAGCSSDGGISGTGTGDELLGDNTPQTSPDTALTLPPSTTPDEATPEQGFENDRAAYPGITPYLRAVNLSGRAVTVSVDGTDRLGLAPAGTSGVVPDSAIGLAAVNPGNDLFSVAIDGDAASIARIGVDRLRPGSLTTLLVQEAEDGDLVLTPLVTLATPPNDGTALVRVAFAVPPDEAATFAATLSLAPEAGGATTRFPARGLSPGTSGYAELAPGDYSLRVDGDGDGDGDGVGLDVTVAAGDVVTIVFAPPGADGTPGPFRQLVDSELQ